jgi:hypothetical protein
MACATRSPLLADRAGFADRPLPAGKQQLSGAPAALWQGAALADEAVEGGVGRERAWVREVALECDGVPVIFAHTTLAATGNGRLTRWMSRLGSRSLGSLLFAYPGFRRGAIEFLRLDCRHPLYQRAAALGGGVRTVGEAFLAPLGYAAGAGDRSFSAGYPALK